MRALTGLGLGLTQMQSGLISLIVPDSAVELDFRDAGAGHKCRSVRLRHFVPVVTLAQLTGVVPPASCTRGRVSLTRVPPPALLETVMVPA